MITLKVSVFVLIIPMLAPLKGIQYMNPLGLRKAHLYISISLFEKRGVGSSDIHVWSAYPADIEVLDDSRTILPDPPM